MLIISQNKANKTNINLQLPLNPIKNQDSSKIKQLPRKLNKALQPHQQVHQNPNNKKRQPKRTQILKVLRCWPRIISQVMITCSRQYLEQNPLEANRANSRLLRIQTRNRG